MFYIYTHTYMHAYAEIYCVYMHAHTDTKAYMEDNGREET